MTTAPQFARDKTGINFVHRAPGDQLYPIAQLHKDKQAFGQKYLAHTMGNCRNFIVESRRCHGLCHDNRPAFHLNPLHVVQKQVVELPLLFAKRHVEEPPYHIQFGPMIQHGGNGTGIARSR